MVTRVITSSETRTVTTHDFSTNSTCNLSFRATSVGNSHLVASMNVNILYRNYNKRFSRKWSPTATLPYILGTKTEKRVVSEEFE